MLTRSLAAHLKYQMYRCSDLTASRVVTINLLLILGLSEIAVGQCNCWLWYWANMVLSKYGWGMMEYHLKAWWKVLNLAIFFLVAIKVSLPPHSLCRETYVYLICQPKASAKQLHTKGDSLSYVSHMLSFRHADSQSEDPICKIGTLKLQNHSVAYKPCMRDD